MHNLVRILCLLVIATPAVIAQQEKRSEARSVQVLPGDVPTREQVLKTFLHPEDTKKNVRGFFETLKQRVRDSLQKEAKNDPDKLKLVDGIADDVMNMFENLSTNDVINTEVAVYQRRFTVSDLQTLATFTSTPAMQKMAKQTELLRLIMQVQDPRERKLLESKPLPVDAPSREQVMRMFDAMQARANLARSVDVIRQQTVTAANSTLKQQGIDPTSLKDTDQQAKDASLDRTMDGVLVVYQRYLSAAEVESITAFFSTPLGQKALAAEQEIVAETAKMVAPLARKFIEAVFERLQEYESKETKKNH